MFNYCSLRQIVSQFSSISQDTGGGGTYPEPAATFTQILSLSNFDVLMFFRPSCSSPSATFYTTLLFKTTLLPLGPVALLWIWAALGTKRNSTAAKLSLLYLELVVTTG